MGGNKAPRMVYKNDWQVCTDNVLDVYVDMDVAGCVDMFPGGFLKKLLRNKETLLEKSNLLI